MKALSNYFKKFKAKEKYNKARFSAEEYRHSITSHLANIEEMTCIIDGRGNTIYCIRH
jgi:hypothetical protein